MQVKQRMMAGQASVRARRSSGDIREQMARVRAARVKKRKEQTYQILAAMYAEMAAGMLHGASV
jgi:hypothetical protein